VVSETYPTRVRRVGVRDVYGESGQAAELLDKFGLRARDIVREALRILENQHS
jgi:transketolase